MKKEADFTKSYDTVLLVFDILSRLGSGKINNFDERLKSQKIHYFAQLFEVAPHYSFNLYLRGPYSPCLANDLYEIYNTKETKRSNEKFTPDELEERFNELNKFIGNKSIRELEIIATLHWFLKVASLNIKEATQKLKELKNASSFEIKYAIKEFNLIKNQ